VSDTPRTDAKAQFFGWNPDEGEEFVTASFCRELERENAALRALLSEPYGFFTFGHKALSPWGKALDNWCERAKPLLEKKEAQP